MTEGNLMLLKILRKLTRIEKKLNRYTSQKEVEHMVVKGEMGRLKRE